MTGKTFRPCKTRAVFAGLTMIRTVKRTDIIGNSRSQNLQDMLASINEPRIETPLAVDDSIYNLGVQLIGNRGIVDRMNTAQESIVCKCLHHRLVLRIVRGIGIFEQELNTLGKLLITENIQVVGGIAHIVFRAILLLHLNLVVAVPVLTLRAAKEPNVIFKSALVNITVCILLRDILECKIFKHAKLLPIHIMLCNLIVRKAFARCVRKHSLKLPGSVERLRCHQNRNEGIRTRIRQELLQRIAIGNRYFGKFLSIGNKHRQICLIAGDKICNGFNLSLLRFLLNIITRQAHGRYELLLQLTRRYISIDVKSFQ